MEAVIERKAALEADHVKAYIDFDEYGQSDFTEEAADFWESQNDAYKLSFLIEFVSHLTFFSREVLKDPWLVDFLPVAIAFFDLYGTWYAYFCPDPACFRLFPNDESLIIHLKCEHFPEIHPIAWPTQRHSLAVEQRCADALRKMVWKPIVAEAALDMLSSICLKYQQVVIADVCSVVDLLNSLNLLYSDDPERKRLLVVLEEKFQILLAGHERASLTFLSKGYLTTMFALASKLIFADRPRRLDKMYLQQLLALTPFSFCLLKASDLNRFVELLEPMCLFAQQAMNRESDSVVGVVNWESENGDTHCISQDESLFYSPEEETLCYGRRVFTMESILSLYHGPRIPTIPKVSPEAGEIFSTLKDVLKDLRVPASTGSDFQGEQKHLQHVHGVQCLESQLRQVCMLDCRLYIVPLMRSILRLKLYFRLRCHQLEAREEDPASLYLEEHTEYYDSESEYDSDCEQSKENIYEYNYDSDLDYKPWRDNPTLCRLDSTLSESATGEAEGSGPFFWLAISDVLRHCQKKPCGAGYESVRGGIKQFTLNKAWKYWICYHCHSTFNDRESHMMHVENEHQLSIDHNEYWLIPQQDSVDDGGVYRQDVAKRQAGLEDSITLDHTYDYFLVDSRKFYEIPSANEEEEPGQEKLSEYLWIFHDLQGRCCLLKMLLGFKCKILKQLEVVNALGLMLFNGGQPLPVLVSWLHKHSIMDWHVGTIDHFQFRFLSTLLDRAHTPCCGPLSNNSVLKAFKGRESLLTCQLASIDKEILKVVYEIEDMKLSLSDLCECDYRTKIVPSVRSLLHAKFKFDNSLRSFDCNNVKEFLLTCDQWLHWKDAYSFKATVASSGKVIINTTEESPWAFAFIGIRLRFSGKWSVTKETELTGVFEFGGWYNWGADTYSTSGSLTLDDRAVMESSSNWNLLESLLCEIVSGKLLSFTWKNGAQIRCHSVDSSAD